MRKIGCGAPTSSSLADQLSALALENYGNRVVKAPHIVALSERGTPSGMPVATFAINDAFVRQLERHVLLASFPALNMPVKKVSASPEPKPCLAIFTSTRCATWTRFGRGRGAHRVHQDAGATSWHCLSVAPAEASVAEPQFGLAWACAPDFV